MMQPRPRGKIQSKAEPPVPTPVPAAPFGRPRSTVWKLAADNVWAIQGLRCIEITKRHHFEAVLNTFLYIYIYSILQCQFWIFLDQAGDFQQKFRTRHRATCSIWGGNRMCLVWQHSQGHLVCQRCYSFMSNSSCLGGTAWFFFGNLSIFSKILQVLNEWMTSKEHTPF